MRVRSSTSRLAILGWTATILLLVYLGAVLLGTLGIDVHVTR